jgi:hypothetical protein
MAIRRAAWGFVAACLLASVFVVAQAAPSSAFTDVPETHLFHDDISWADRASIARGFDDDTFRPATPVTRGAMTAFLVRLVVVLGGHVEQETEPTFTDVTLLHPFHETITYVAAAGLAEGYPDGSFRPDDAVTRGEMAALLQRTWMLLDGPEPGPAGPPFIDVGVGHPFREAIDFLAATGVAEGYADGRFRPGEAVARESMAAFLRRSFGELVGPGCGAPLAAAASLPSACPAGPPILVDTPLDAPDDDEGDDRCATAAGRCTLRAAVDLANHRLGPDLIAVAPGVHPVLTIAGDLEDANATGDVDSTGPLDLRGNGAVVDAAQLDRALHAQADLAVDRLTITNGNGGGGGALRSGASLVLVDTTLADSGAVGGGGLLAEGGPVDIRTSTFSGNTVGQGGGIALVDVDQATISTSTISGNEAFASAAGLWLDNSTVTLRSVTMADNAAWAEPSIDGEGDSHVTLVASIVVAWMGWGCGQVDLVSLGWNLGPASCGMDHATDIVTTAVTLGGLGDNGGPTATMVPAVGSPAHDAIPPSTPDLCDGSGRDQRGVTRPQGLGCEIGAAEISATP